MDKAREQFERIVKETDYYSALLNLGNIAYLSGECESAVEFYERACGVAPDSGPAILEVARASLAIEDYVRVREAYDQLKMISPSLAAEHSYLESRRSSSSRARGISVRGNRVIWMDE